MRTDEANLTDRGVLDVAGPEAREFLQRLVTSDVVGLAPGQARYTALLTPQGKITADFFVVASPSDADTLLLDVPAALLGDVAKRLTLYRLRAKATITDRSEAFGVMAFTGEAPPAALVTYADPRAPGLWARAIVRRGEGVEGVGDAGRWAYREQRIRAGVPEGGLDFAYGETFPHEANLDRLGGVDFRKGCYVGQEVVSRVEHRGTARKRVARLAFEGEAPAIGVDIMRDGMAIGTMGSSIDGLGLALLRLDRAEEPGVTLEAGGVPVRLLPGDWNPAAKPA